MAKHFRAKSAVHTVFARCPPPIHRVILTRPDWQFINGFHRLGKADRRKDPTGAPRHTHDLPLSELGHLVVLAYQVGHAGGAWSTAQREILRKNNQGNAP
jgi:hypothetical protein